MSFDYYTKLWLETQKDLEKLIELDQTVLNGKPIERREDAIDKVLEFYYRYRIIIQRLTQCHDQIVQPQVRDIIGKMLDHAIARMLEYRFELVNLTFTESTWPLDKLIELQLTPDDVDLTTPIRNSKAREAEFERRLKVIENAELEARRQEAEIEESTSATTTSKKERMLEAQCQTTSDQISVKETKEQIESRILNDAVLLIQNHERCRIARMIVRNKERRQIFDKRMAAGEITHDATVDEQLLVKSAIVIQKYWRGYLTRCEIERKYQELDELIGIAMPAWKSQEIHKKSDEAAENLMILQEKAARNYTKVIKDETEKIWEVHGPRVLEDVIDEIRAWFNLWFNEVGYFDAIPSEEHGGSIRIATGESRTPQEYSAPTKDVKQHITESNDQDPLEESEEEGWTMQESIVFPLLVDANKELVEKWSRYTDQISDNGPIIMDIVFNELYYDLHLGVRKMADETMRLELMELNQALLSDYAQDGVTLEIPQPQVFEDIIREKEEPQSKGKPDILADVSADELLIKLSNMQVIRTCPECRLSDWPGTLTYCVRNENEIRLGDVKQPIMDYCILPMGSKTVHELSPLVRSVCICGMPDAGQNFLAHAVCTELKATVFDLSPERHKRRFKTRSSQDWMVQAVIKLAKEYAPSIILVEGETAWMRKPPANVARSQPRRFVPLYKKIVKEIKPGDQVLFLTTAMRPYTASGALVTLHDKMIITPVVDQGTAYRVNKKRLPDHIDSSCLGRLVSTNPMTLDVFRDLLDRVTRIDRRIQYRRNPLKPSEMLEQIFLIDQPDTDYCDFNKFLAKLPLARKKAKYLEENQLST